MDKILIDSDVCLDSFTVRYPFNVEADKLLLMVEDSLVQGIVSAESFSNMHYVLRKFSSSQTSFELLNQLKMIVSNGIVDSEVVTQALQSGWNDLEDAIQYYCAVKESCDAIITRNTKDYTLSEIPVYNPSDWLKKNSQ